ncbi:hypothetical protein HRbin10_01022 [bacterium HR10]|uniref:Hypothetical conserved protein n=1 Tax=uncultured Acidobacteriota bacterium TaxID=171953 RepID=H5SH72_9BACT|nr:hypothetical conserved protein [uncultured Acidobacteriota bacterium]GBC81907.1 hypothetical protein HRbin10_01022 [bacterium HR10]
MIWEFALLEMRRNIRLFKAQVVMVIALLLVIVSFYTMWTDYKQRLAHFSPVLNSPWEVSIAPRPLSLFVKGCDALMGRTFTSNWWSRIIWGSLPIREQGTGFFVIPDLFFLVGVVMTLAAIFFSFDLISGEREVGTLPLLLSNAVSRDVVILGKVLGAQMCILVPFLGSVFLGTVLLIVFGGVPLTLEDLGRLGVIWGAGAALISFFFLLGVCASILFSRSATSLIVLLFCWVIAVFGIPSVSPLLAEKFVGVPTREFLLQKRSHVWIRSVVERERAERRGESYSTQKVREMFERIVSENRRLFEDYRQKLERLIVYADYLSMSSPVGCYRVIATSFAGTSPRDYLDLQRALARYYYSLPISAAEEKGPPFTYRPRSPWAGGDGTIAWSGGILVLENVILFLLAYTLFLKADVRSG